MNTTVVTAQAPALSRLGPIRTVECRNLRVAYIDDGPTDGDVVLLLHGLPYDIHSYVEVIPRLVDAGLRVIVPYLPRSRSH
jgi:pimeloyl-ACP methyl ester carboxylesterase